MENLNNLHRHTFCIEGGLKSDLSRKALFVANFFFEKMELIFLCHPDIDDGVRRQGRAELSWKPVRNAERRERERRETTGPELTL